MATQSSVVREAVEAWLDREPRKGSCLDLVRDLAGSIPGPADLSTKRRHLDGLGE